MAITLKESIVGMTSPVDQAIADYFQRKSFILSEIPFKDDVSPQGGSTLSYTYQYEKTPSYASGRAINSEYIANEAIRDNKTTYLKVLGGSYEIDRVLAHNPAGREDEVSYQNRKKSDATINKFHHDFINGNSAKNPLEFDGLKELLKDTVQEIDGSSLNVATMTKDKALLLCDAFDEAIAKLGRKPNYILTGSKGLLKAKSAARYAEYYSHDEDAFGRSVDNYDGIPLVNIGEYYDGPNNKLVDIIPVRENDEYRETPVTSDTFTTDGSLFTLSGSTYSAVSSGTFNSATKYYKKLGATGSTDFYFVCLGEDEVCALSPNGTPLVAAHLPNFNEAKAVHVGDVEAVWGLMMKTTKAAAVIQGVKVV